MSALTFQGKLNAGDHNFRGSSDARRIKFMPTLRQSLVARLTRLYPLYSGCGTFANSRLVQRLAGPSDEVAWARVPGGFLVPAPINDYVGRAVFYCGDLDRKISWVLRRLVRRGDVVLDIGANLGLTTFILSNLVGPEGAVHAFEPNPPLQRLIELAIEKNGASNVVVHRTALGATEGQLDLHVPDGHAGRASLVRDSPRAHGRTIKVPVQSLSTLLSRLNLGSIRLVKMDVEGFEAEVLKGAEKYFRESPPDAIVFEMNRASGPMNEQAAVTLLDRLGYGFFSVPRTFVRMKVRPSDTRAPAAGHDVVAALKGDVYQQIGRALSAPW